MVGLAIFLGQDVINAKCKQSVHQDSILLNPDGINTGARGLPVIILCALSFSSDFDRGTYRLSCLQIKREI